MKTKIFIVVMSVSCFFGCDSKIEHPAKLNVVSSDPSSTATTDMVAVKESIRLMCDTLGKQGESEEFYRQMGDFLRSAEKTSDVAAIVLVHDALRDSLLSVDFSGLSYKEQARVFRKIQDLVYGNKLFGLLHHAVIPRDLWVEKEIETGLKSLAWQRATLKRLRPRRRLAKKLSPAEDEKACEEWDAWRCMYYDGIQAYEGLMRHIEKLCHDGMRGLQPELADQIRKSVEEYIGRPIRTAEQLRKDHILKRPVEFLEEEDPLAAP